MRERTTWNRDEILKRAALNKKADPYSMNQEHKQPSADKYVSGDPSSWAEDVHSPNEWDKEYANGQTKRNEVGMPEMRSETFSHPEKTASETQLLVKKADLCVKVARAMLGKKASDEVVEDQAVALMSLADGDLIDTFNRLAQDEQGQQQAEEPKQAQEQGQSQEQAPPAQQTQQAAAPQQQTAAEAFTYAQQHGDADGMKQALQQMVQEALAQQAPAQAPAQEQAPMQAQASTKKKAQDDQGQQAPAQEQKEAAPQAPVAQGQQMDLQAMIQSAVQAALQGQQAPMQAQEQAPPPAEEQMPLANDQMLLDEMLSPGAGPGAMAAGAVGDIELDPAPMDVGEVGLSAEDDVLKTLFANDESEAQQQMQEKQAAVVRTASTRTVGTKPTAGVSRVGGLGGQTKTAGTNDVDKLSSLWSSAPDVKEHFGLK